MVLLVPIAHCLIQVEPAHLAERRGCWARTTWHSFNRCRGSRRKELTTTLRTIVNGFFSMLCLSLSKSASSTWATLLLASIIVCRVGLFARPFVGWSRASLSLDDHSLFVAKRTAKSPPAALLAHLHRHLLSRHQVAAAVWNVCSTRPRLRLVVYQFRFIPP